MDSRKKMNGERSLEEQERRIKIPRRSFADKWRDRFRRRGRRHDPMLVLSMSTFNFDCGWSRVFDPLHTHENGNR